MDIFQLSYWHWWILAAALLMLEFLAIGTFGSFFLWPAIAAVTIGFLTLLFPMLSVEYQILILAMVSIISVVIGRVYLGKHPLGTDEPYLNQRGAELVGRTYKVSQAIVNGIGRIHVDDGSWRVEGVDCPIGTLVKIVGSGGVRLKVKPVFDNVKKKS
ncbi:MAG: NfeD family protein [Thiomargarita sp.]|nr:NfeD family protein [Thiomargarita sp.]